MELIPLEPIPNQTLTVAQDSHAYELTVRTLQDGICIASVARDGITIIESARCVPNYFLMRYRYLEGDSGNFVWSTPDDEYPDYTKFGVTHFLYFINAAELQAIRNGTA